MVVGGSECLGSILTFFCGKQEKGGGGKAGEKELHLPSLTLLAELTLSLPESYSVVRGRVSSGPKPYCAFPLSIDYSGPPKGVCVHVRVYSVN